MKLDPGSNYNIALVEAQNTLAAAGTNTTSSVDCSTGRSASFAVAVSSVGTGGELTMKVQYSDDDSSWTDEPDTNAGNDTTVTIDATGLTQIDVPNPRGRYVRLHGTAATDDIGYSVIAINGPKNDF
jgi:hypothetical protein